MEVARCNPEQSATRRARQNNPWSVDYLPGNLKKALILSAPQFPLLQSELYSSCRGGLRWYLNELMCAMLSEQPWCRWHMRKAHRKRVWGPTLFPRERLGTGEQLRLLTVTAHFLVSWGRLPETPFAVQLLAVDTAGILVLYFPRCFELEHATERRRNSPVLESINLSPAFSSEAQTGTYTLLMVETVTTRPAGYLKLKGDSSDSWEK